MCVCCCKRLCICVCCDKRLRRRRYIRLCMRLFLAAQSLPSHSPLVCQTPTASLRLTLIHTLDPPPPPSRLFVRTRTCVCVCVCASVYVRKVGRAGEGANGSEPAAEVLESALEGALVYLGVSKQQTQSLVVPQHSIEAQDGCHRDPVEAQGGGQPGPMEKPHETEAQPAMVKGGEQAQWAAGDQGQTSGQTAAVCTAATAGGLTSPSANHGVGGEGGGVRREIEAIALELSRLLLSLGRFRDAEDALVQVRPHAQTAVVPGRISWRVG